MFRKTVYQVGQVLVARIMLRGAMFLTLVILARSLEPAAFGFYGYAMALLLVLSQVGHLGLRQAGAFALGQRKLERERVEWTLLAGWLATGLPALGIMALAVWPEQGIDGAAKLLAILAVLPMLFVVVFQGVFLGEGRMGDLSRSDVLPRLVTLLGVAALALGGLVDAAAAFALLLAGYAIGGLHIVRLLRGRLLGRPRVDWPGLGWMFRHGMMFAVPYGLQLATAAIGVVMVKQLLSLEAAGLYFGALKLVEVIAELAITTGTVLFSIGVRQAPTGSPEAADAEAARAEQAKAARERANALKLMRLTATAVALAALVMGLFAGPILALLLGPEFARAADVLRLLLLGGLCAAITKNLHMYLSAQGHPQASAGVFAGLLPVAVLLFWLLIPAYGLPGAALAGTIAQALGMLAFLGVAWRRLAIRPQQALFTGPVEAAGLVRAVLARLAGRLSRPLNHLERRNHYAGD